MHKNKTKTIIFVAISVFIFVGIRGAGTASAVSAGLGISAHTIDLEVPAGDTYADDLTIFNHSTSTALPVHIDLALWNLKEDADDIEFIRAEEGLNATKWFKIDTVDMILEPNSFKEINYTVSPPKDVAPGSYFVIMRFQPTFPEFYFVEEGPRFIPEVGTLFFIKVPLFSLDGESGYGANIESLEPRGSDHIGIIENIIPRADTSVFDGAVKVLDSRISNTGIFHFKVAGTIKIKNIFGRTVAEKEIPDRYLLPNRTRPIETILLPPPTTKSLPFLRRIVASAIYKLRTNTYLGPYRAVATLVVPEQDAPVVETVNFWVIPWQFWLIVGALVFVLAIAIRKDRGRFTLALKVLIERKNKRERG